MGITLTWEKFFVFRDRRIGTYTNMDWGTDLWVSLLHRHSYAFLLISVVWEKNICVKVNAAFEGKF